MATGSFLGLTANALAASPDGIRLYVAEAGLNAVAVYDTAMPFAPQFLGHTFKQRPANDTHALWQLQSKIKHVFLILRENKTYDTEDDAQGSPNHVSAHRSYVMVVSPRQARPRHPPAQLDGKRAQDDRGAAVSVADEPGRYDRQ